MHLCIDADLRHEPMPRFRVKIEETRNEGRSQFAQGTDDVTKGRGGDALLEIHVLLHAH